MDSDLIDAWSAAASTHFTAIELVLPAATLRICSGGFVSFDVDGSPQAFDAEDSTYGTLIGAGPITDGIEASPSAARLKVAIAPPSDTAVEALTAPGAQGSAIRIWQGAIVEATGLADGEPELIFSGVLDFARLTVDAAGWAVALECGTDEELQLEPDGQRRLSDQFHRMVWPGEYGLQYVTNTTRKIYWRLAEPRGPAGAGGGGGDRGGLTNPDRRLF